MKGTNHFEYTRGLIVASILWVGFVLFLALTDIISNLLEWALGNHWIRTLLFISFVIVGAMLLVRIGGRAFNKLTINRFKYFPTEKMKKALEDKEAKQG